MKLAGEKGYHLELRSTITNLADGKRSLIAKFRVERGPKTWKLAEEIAQQPGVASIEMREKTG